MVTKLKNLGLVSYSGPTSGSIHEKEVTKPVEIQQPKQQVIKSEDIIAPILVHHEKEPVIKKGEAGTKQVSF